MKDTRKCHPFVFPDFSHSYSFFAARLNCKRRQGCQMVCFQTQNPNLGKFWRALEWKMFVYFMTIWNNLRPFDIIYGRLVKFVVIWYIFPILVCLDQEKSGNPERRHAMYTFNASFLKAVGGQFIINLYRCNSVELFFKNGPCF
jgi:hypothetical protein